MKKYFYHLLRRYVSLFVLPQNSVVEIDPANAQLIGSFPQGKIAFRNGRHEEGFDGADALSIEEVGRNPPDFLVVSGLIHYERDIQALFAAVRQLCRPDTRLIVTYYSSLWRPFAALASRFNLRGKLPEANWLAHEDIHNLLDLEDFELIRLDQRILVPFYIPLFSSVINRFIAPLPFFRIFCLLNIAIARPKVAVVDKSKPSVSIVVPARNEAGNIEEIVRRIPAMGPEDEIIFVEGNSTDETWETIKTVSSRYGDQYRIITAQQDAKGKGEAVRKGFSLATKDILMILDADMTVPPEDLPKFYQAIVADKGEFINGTRLVYPMEKGAMRFFNLIGNKFFAIAFSFVLGQRYKDTLCGTKVISRANYLKLEANRSYFGEFDPFGDFDLIFGAARMGLKIVEVPISYRERVYGDTNISRWRHGAILLAMLVFAARKIKFL